MKNRILLALPLLAVTVALSACDQMGKPTPAEAGAIKLSKVAAKARALCARIASSAEAVGTAGGEGDGAAGSGNLMLAPAAAAEQLRTLAGEAAGAGATEAQRKEGAALAQRLKREAAVLDLIALENIESRIRALTAAVAAELSLADLIDNAADPQTLAAAEARVKVTRDALSQFDTMLKQQAEAASMAGAALKKLETEAQEAASKADEADAEAQVLRSEAATATPSVAQPKVVAAVQRMNEARVLRREAAERDMAAVMVRDQANLTATAVKEGEQAKTWLAGRLTEAEKAEKTLEARGKAALQAAKDLRAEAAKQVTEIEKLSKDEFLTLWTATKDNLDSSLATRVSTDAALIALAKARLYSLSMDNAAQGMRLANLAGMKDAASAMKEQIATMSGSAKAALLEARDALSGQDSSAAQGMMGAVKMMADALGVDLSTPAPAPAPAPAAEQPAGDAAPAAPAATEAPAGDQPASPPPADAPPSDTPPAAPPSPDEPNK